MKCNRFTKDCWLATCHHKRKCLWTVQEVLQEKSEEREARMIIERMNNSVDTLSEDIKSSIDKVNDIIKKLE